MLRVATAAAAAGKVQFADHEISQVKSSQRLWLPDTVRNVAAYANKNQQQLQRNVREEGRVEGKDGRERSVWGGGT